MTTIKLLLIIVGCVIIIHQVLLRIGKRFVHHPATGLYDPRSPSR